MSISTASISIRSLPARMLLPAALALLLFVALSSTALAQTRPHYDLEATVSDSLAVVEVEQKTTFRNNTGVPLSELVFQVTSAYFNAFTLQSAAVDGRAVRASLNGTVLELPLAQPLPAGHMVEVQLSYRLDVPAISGRFGRGQGILALGQWFPILAVYADGWLRHQYVDVGDAFYAEVADFDVVIVSSGPLMIASTGWLSDWERGRQSFRAENVREVGIAISRDYKVGARIVDGVALMAYGMDERRLRVYLDAAERKLRWFSANYGRYDYPFLTIAEISDNRSVPIAQEFPGLIFVNSSLGADGGGPGSYSEYLVGHEVAHQWFYAMVGNDQVRDPWLDEAFATYSSMLYYRSQYRPGFDHYWNRNVTAYRARVAAGGDRPVNTTINDYPNDLIYFDIVYRKGAIFLDELRQLMGDAAFFGLIRDYVDTYRGKMATPRAFLDMAYSRGGSQVPALIARYFSYGAWANGNGYRLDVDWPAELTAWGWGEIGYRTSFQVAREEVWLDNRLLHRGVGNGVAGFSLQIVEAGEYILRLDLTDQNGALYQRSKRVTVSPAR
jgi:hypothetical protein